ncbi:PaaX family transcriptional regulator [Oricola indica]|uniref:PaaX family transcriptional regulator n=1 Tax=Oricola indica TaxID=2872591 RepID=UPI003CCB7614
MQDIRENWDTILDGLRGQNRLRVWSVIITVFGDSIVPRGGSIPLQSLQEIMGRLGIESGAVRTALSRLASEGWVIRERQGRLSHYSLDRSGRRAFDEATQRIYAPGPPKWDGRWTVVVPMVGDDAAGSDLRTAGFASRYGTWIRPESVGARPLPDNLGNYLVIKGQPGSAPGDAYKFWNLDGVAEAVGIFIDTLKPLAAALDAGQQPGPLDAMALRTLVIHEWRRIVLRAPALPVELLPPSWPALEGRVRLGAVYGKLADASERWLDGIGLPPQSDPQTFAARFGGSAEA